MASSPTSGAGRATSAVMAEYHRGLASHRHWTLAVRGVTVAQFLDPTTGEVYGIPEVDDPPLRHRGFSGEETPPVRW